MHAAVELERGTLCGGRVHGVGRRAAYLDCPQSAVVLVLGVVGAGGHGAGNAGVWIFLFHNYHSLLWWHAVIMFPKVGIIPPNAGLYPINGIFSNFHTLYIAHCRRDSFAVRFSRQRTSAPLPTFMHFRYDIFFKGNPVRESRCCSFLILNRCPRQIRRFTGRFFGEKWDLP